MNKHAILPGKPTVKANEKTECRPMPGTRTPQCYP